MSKKPSPCEGRSIFRPKQAAERERASGAPPPHSKHLLLLLLAVLCVWTCSCADGHRPDTSRVSSFKASSDQRANSSNAPGSYLHSDSDHDEDDQVPDRELRVKSDLLSSGFGHAASASVRREISTLVKRYYTAAAAGDGRSACSMLDPSITTGLASGASGGGCVAATERLFGEQRAQLAKDRVVTMTVAHVRVKGHMAVALVGFQTAPVGEVELKRDRGGWKMNVLLDSGLS